MAARDIQFVQGAYYHIYNRGAGRLSIFRSADNYIFVLKKIKHYLSELQLTMIVYCLLPNHYHFLVRQDGVERAGLLPQRVFNSYTKALNKSNGRSGTLFEGPFEAKPVNSDEYLRHLCRYIHANPVRHGFALSPDLWSYSNYIDWLGNRNGTLLDRAFISAHFGSPQQYEQSVLEYLTGQINVPEGVRKYLHTLRY